MKKFALLILLLPYTLFAQEEKRTSLFISTSQGISFVHKEALSNTTAKTYPMSMGYAFSISSGISILSKSKKSFSDIKLSFRSFSNGIKDIASPYSASGVSSKTSRDRFNYLGLGYSYSRYVFEIKGFKSFISTGVELSYILNRKMKLNYDDRSTTIKVKGKNISNNYGILTPPTFSLGYGIDLGKGIYKIGKNSRISVNLTWDPSILRKSSPSNQYISGLVRYQLIF